MTAATKKNLNQAPGPRAQDIDHLEGARMRARRVLPGMTRQRMAEQAHTYDKGINRIAAGRLNSIAQALRVEVGSFYDGMDKTVEALKATPPQRLLLELAQRNLPVSGQPTATAAMQLEMGS